MPGAMATQWLLNALSQTELSQTELTYTALAQIAPQEWEAVVQLANTHGVTPLLYHRLKQSPALWSAIPTPIQQQLQERYLSSAYTNLRLYHQFLTLLKAFNQVGIPVIVLKGGYLAHVIYGDRALRPMGDIDILVKQANIEDVERILQSFNYTLSEWKNRAWCLRNHYHLSYLQPELHVHIEIHWHIQRPQAPYVVNIDELWQRAQPVMMAGAQAWALSHEHLILHHCLHIAKHGFGVGLRPFCDLVAILDKFGEQIDWAHVQTEAQRWGITKALYLSLYFTEEFFGVVPPALLAGFKPTTLDPAIVLAAREQIFTFGTSVKRLSTDFLDLWEGEVDANKVVQLFRRVFLPPNLMSSVYGMAPDSWRIYLYYPVRLFDLLLRYPVLTRRLLRRDEETLTLAQETTKVDSLRKWLAT